MRYRWGLSVFADRIKDEVDDILPKVAELGYTEVFTSFELA